MSEEKKLKDSRDRFVAFSFATSDFLLEIDQAHNVTFASGQVKSLTGLSEKAIAGKSCFLLFSSESAQALQVFLKSGKKSGRVGPVMVDILNQENKEQTPALLMGMYIPDNPHIFLALNATQSFHDFLATGGYQDADLLDEKEFEMEAIKAFDDAKREGKTLDVTFLESQDIEAAKKNLTPDQARVFDKKFKTLLKEQSYKGTAASQMDDDKYALIHDTEITSDFIEKKIEQLVKDSKANVEKLSIQSKTTKADMTALNEREARRALLYTMKQIEEQGLDAAGEDLSKSFDEYLQENAD
ncbi:MAG: PAS domain-containing protein, partial [Pseudomonadota bacterium]